MKALIDIRIGRVCEIHDKEFPVDPRALEWVDCDETITVQHTYVDGLFVEPFVDQVEIDKQAEGEIKGALKLIDIQSVRGIREWIIKQADAPQLLKDRELEAVATRMKL